MLGRQVDFQYFLLYRFCLEQDVDLKIKQVSLACSKLDKSVQFWKDLLGMTVIGQSENEVIMTYGNDQASLRLVSTGGKPVDHATAFGRIAFALPTPDLPGLESKVKEADLGAVKTPLVVLPTPGKADVQVVILEDPVRFNLILTGYLAYSTTYCRIIMKFALLVRKALLICLKLIPTVTSCLKTLCLKTKATNGSRRRTNRKKLLNKNHCF